MAKFTVTFADGSTRQVDAASGDEAKQKARSEAQREHGFPPATPRADARVKIASVAETREP